MRRVKPQEIQDDRTPHVVPSEEYIYRDISLDLKLGKLQGNSPANKRLNNTDIEDIRDIDAIKQSVSNIFNTKPGEKLLNPYLGCDLTRFVFDPISEQTGDLIARAILKGLAEQEPRIRVSHLIVVGDVVQNQYNVQFILEFPDLNIDKVPFNGNLTTQGFIL